MTLIAYKNKIIVAIIFLVLLCSSSVILDRIILHECAQNIAGHIFANLPEINPGYILLAPYIADNFYAKSGEVDLLDSYGRTVHSWTTKYQTLYSILEPTGNLYVAMTPPINQSAYPSGGTTGEIQELDWNGKILWDYTDPEMTHDFEVLPHGDIAYTRWELAPDSFAKKVMSGMQVASSSVWTDGIVVVNRSKQVIWQWHLYDHLNPKDYSLGPLTPRNDWAHVNSTRYTADNPITHTAAFLISVRHISTVFLLDAKTGDIIWRSPKALFSMQHDATLLDNGDIMVFDNGLFRPMGKPFLSSRAIEIDPRTNAIVWKYAGGKTGTEQSRLASSIMGGAQRLPNGNTLITISVEGRIFEVTPNGQLAWEYAQPLINAAGQSPIIFKARKYTAVGTEWAAWLPKYAAFTSFVCALK